MITTSPFLLDHELSVLLHHTVCQMASQMRRRSSTSMDRASAQAILTPADSGQPSPVQAPHLCMSPNQRRFDMPPPPSAFAEHIPASTSTPRNPNRLSLNFPIVGANGTDSPRQTPISMNNYSFPPTPAEVVPSPSDPSALFVAMAAQERKVLEMKEELQKAEKELEGLKLQWSKHERKRKVAETRHSEPLQPLQTVVAGAGRSSEDSQGMRQSMEIERRKSLILKNSKDSRRKQFSGSHTRALSLLSPERSNFTHTIPPVNESSTMGLPTPRSTTLPDMNRGVSVNKNRNRHSYQSGVTEGAKLLAEDIKTGMWTFLEDLRQATIGEEATIANSNRVGLDLAHSGPKKKGSKGSLRSNKNRHPYSPGGSVLPRTWDSLTGSNLGLGISDEGAPWPGPPCLTPSKTPTLKKKVSRHLSFTPNAVDNLDDDWSAWDTPTPKSLRWSGSTDNSDPATPAHSTGEDRSVK
jgi:hypothetical protein